jgi:hypothetical protein
VSELRSTPRGNWRCSGVADRVEENLHTHMEAHAIADTWQTRERVVVAVTGAPGGQQLVRRDDAKHGVRVDRFRSPTTSNA